MSASTTPTTSMSASELERQLVVFSMHGESYGFPITSVREIIRYTTPGATGAANGLVQGMICLRERVLPVVDLSSRLGKALEINNGTKILVTEIESGAVGLIVDIVDDRDADSRRPDRAAAGQRHSSGRADCEGWRSTHHAGRSRPSSRRRTRVLTVSGRITHPTRNAMLSADCREHR